MRRPTVRLALVPHALVAALALPAAAVGWEHVPTPPQGEHRNHLRGVHGTSPSDVWAVGEVMNGTSGPGRHSLVLHFDGTAWTQVPSPSPGVYAGGGTRVYLNDVHAFAPDDAWAVGTYYTQHPVDNYLGFQTFALHWDGGQWTQVPTPATPVGGTGADLLRLVVGGPDDLYAVGYRVGPDFVGLSTVGLVLHWDGSTWSELPTPPVPSADHHILRGGVITAPGELLVVGGHSGNDYGPADTPWVLRWDGSGWSEETTPAPDDFTPLFDVGMTGPQDIWVVGYTLASTTQPYVLRYDGGWQEVPMTGFDASAGWLYTVEVGPSGVFAAGDFTANPPPDYGRPLLLAWQGGSWAQVPPPASVEFGFLRGIGNAGGQLWAVGTSLEQGLTLRSPGELIFVEGFEGGAVRGWE